MAARGIHFCKCKNNKTTSENILAHCAKYYYEKCDFCWRHSGVPLHWITISIWNLSFRKSPIFEGQENWLPEASIFACIKITKRLQQIFFSSLRKILLWEMRLLLATFLHWITISIRFGIMNDDNWRGIFNKRSKAKQCNQTLNLTFENGLFNRKLQPNHANMNRHSMVIF